MAVARFISRGATMIRICMEPMKQPRNSSMAFSTSRISTIITARTSGYVTALRTDVVAIGRIKSRLVNGLYDRLDEFEQTVIEVPLGSVLAPHFFSGRGPSLHFGLAGLTQMEAEFVSSFSAAGINQTRHCILIEFHAGFRILTPFVSTFPVTDTVIVGTVPERYAYIGSAGEGLLGEVRDGSSE